MQRMARSACSMGSIFLQIFSFAVVLAIDTSAEKPGNVAPVILVCIDGLGSRFTGGQFANTPHLDYIAETGVKSEYMITTTPTKTWPNLQTYVTGLYPESHGLVDNKFWDPLYKEAFFYDYDCSNYDQKFWNASEPIWLTMQKQGRDTGMYFWPGVASYDQTPTHFEKPVCYVNCSARTLFETTGNIEKGNCLSYFDIDTLNCTKASKDLPLYRNQTRAGWPAYKHCFPNFSEPFPNRIDKMINWFKSERPPQFVGLYIDQPDSAGHVKGPESPEFKREIEFVDREVVGYLTLQLRENQLLDKVNLIFVADHGFTSVNKSRLIYLNDFIDPSTYRLTQGWTLAHIWPNPGQLENIYQNLTKLVKQFPQAKVYKKEDIPDEWHYKNNRRIPPIIVDPGFSWAVDRTFNVSDDWVYGIHGYPASKKLSSIFYARGPDFKKGYLTKRVLRSVDVYPMMCKILGLEPRPNNGSFDNMADLMVNTNGIGCVGSSFVLIMLPVIFTLL